MELRSSSLVLGNSEQVAALVRALHRVFYDQHKVVEDVAKRMQLTRSAPRPLGSAGLAADPGVGPTMTSGDIADMTTKLNAAWHADAATLGGRYWKESRKSDRAVMSCP